MFAASITEFLIVERSAAFSEAITAGGILACGDAGLWAPLKLVSPYLILGTLRY